MYFYLILCTCVVCFLTGGWALLIPATAGVELQVHFNMQRNTTGLQKTTTTPQGSLGCGDKVCKYAPVDTLAQKEWLKPLFLRFFNFSLTHSLPL